MKKMYTSCLLAVLLAYRCCSVLVAQPIHLPLRSEQHGSGRRGDRRAGSCRNTKSTLIGAGVGAVGGAVLNDQRARNRGY